MLRQAVRYHISLNLLDEVKKAEAAGSKPAELLPLLTLLAVQVCHADDLHEKYLTVSQPLRYDHRIINMRHLVSENIKVFSPFFETSSRMLRSLGEESAYCAAILEPIVSLGLA
jgi:hypothetical protein